MSTANSKESYGWIAIGLHWIVAAGVIAMFYTGLSAAAAGEAGDRALRGEWMGFHISMGATLFSFIVARLYWSWTQPQPAPLPQARPLQILSKIVHHLLLVGLLLLIISGPLAVWSGGRAIDVFGLVSLPSPFGAPNEGLHEAAEAAHAIGRILVFFMLALHILGTLKHVVINRDDTLRRMLWVKR